VCGLAGVIITGEKPVPINDLVNLMGETLRHRGPDSGNNWLSVDDGVGFSHRRLSIVDLSAHGQQPMISHDRRYVLAYNGEIYNHLELRTRIEREAPGFRWTGHSDTETLLECFSFWGVEKTLRELVGMFAICLWDSQEKSIVLARDRVGEKPLYYGSHNGIFAFGSELKALRKIDSWDFDINPDAVTSFLRYGYVPEPYSIFRGIHKVPPGTFLKIDSSNRRGKSSQKQTTYWSLAEVARAGVSDPASFSTTDEAISELEHLLSRSIKGQQMGDVPVGAFLSGGIDSSTIVALMQKHAPGKVKTFSVGFDDPAYDESVYASKIAKHLGTDHHELIVSAQEAQDVIPKLPDVYDEPFADSSQIPTYLVSKLAKSEVSVSLSGDGGDEFFGGYNRYVLGAQKWDSLSKIPRFIRRRLGSAAEKVSPETWDRLFDRGSRFLPDSLNLRLPGDKIHKAARVIGSENSRELYRNLTSVIDPRGISSRDQELTLEYDDNWPLESDLAHQMMALDTLTYLPGDILVKMDRASMAHSLESRMPFLDHRIIEFAWRLPMPLKINGSESKWILRALLQRNVPSQIFERPKMGFGIPLGTWLRGPLREWAEELLEPSALARDGFFNVASVQNLWQGHLENKKNSQHGLWNILMFQAWRNKIGSEEKSCEG